MDNYKLYANIIRKPDSSDFNARSCVVEKWVTLRYGRYKTTRAFSRRHDARVCYIYPYR